MRSLFTASLIIAAAVVGPVRAQTGSQVVSRGLSIAKGAGDAVITDEEEVKIGADVSAKLREKYGVVQDAAVHKYVSLVGTTLAQASSRPALHWTFIVLDTDGINAFAAPGGFIHITRGALALIKNEGELADVLAHEISHVTKKHTVRAIEKSKLVGVAADQTRNDLVQQWANKGYEIVLENHYDRTQEMEADKTGVALADKSGWAPTGLGTFLTRLAERNAGLKEPSGIFASHPETEARLKGLTQVISADKLTATALVAPRYAKAISYKLVPINQIAQVAPPSTTPEPKKDEPKKGGSGTFGVKGLPGLGQQNQSNGTIAAAGARGVNPDRDAKGGPNKALVVVTVTPAELTEFKKGIA